MLLILVSVHRSPCCPLQDLGRKVGELSPRGPGTRQTAPVLLQVSGSFSPTAEPAPPVLDEGPAVRQRPAEAAAEAESLFGPGVRAAMPFAQGRRCREGSNVLSLCPLAGRARGPQKTSGLDRTRAGGKKAGRDHTARNALSDKERSSVRSNGVISAFLLAPVATVSNLLWVPDSFLADVRKRADC